MIAWLKRLRNWVVRVFAWLGDARQVWVAVLTIPGVFLICWAAIPSWEPRIRITGMCLELLGLGTVAYGLREIRKLFNQPSMIEVALQWLGSFPKFKFEARIVAGTGHIELGGAAVTAFGTASLAATVSLEERVAFLEKGLNQTNVLIHETQRKIEDEARKRGSTLDAERREREAGDTKNHKLLQEAMAGGLYLETTGVLWLFCGITLATASSDIASFFFGIR